MGTEICITLRLLSKSIKGAKHVFLSAAKNLVESKQPNLGIKRILLGISLSGGFFAALRMTDSPSIFAEGPEGNGVPLGEVVPIWNFFVMLIFIKANALAANDN